MGVLVLLDNGHGRETPGKRSPDGRLEEWAWARGLAGRLEGLIAGAAGLRCARVVPEAADVPLAERARRANALAAEAAAAGDRAVLVSLHCNASGDGRGWMGARGWQAHVARGAGAASRELAACLAGAMAGEGLTVRRPRAGQAWWENDFAILTRTRCPAVLTENLFMDNAADCGMLLREEWQAAIARGHFAGLVRFAAGAGAAW